MLAWLIKLLMSVSRDQIVIRAPSSCILSSRIQVCRRSRILALARGTPDLQRPPLSSSHQQLLSAPAVYALAHGIFLQQDASIDAIIHSAN